MIDPAEMDRLDARRNGDGHHGASVEQIADYLRAFRESLAAGQSPSMARRAALANVWPWRRGGWQPNDATLAEWESRIPGGGPEWEKPIPLGETPQVLGFPVEVLPRQHQAYAVTVAQSVGCPVDFVAGPMLAVAGGAIGASRAVQIKAGFVQRSLLYLSVVGGPGSAKTPAVSHVARPLYEYQRKLKADYDAEIEVYEAAVEAHKRDKKAARGNVEAAEPAAPEPPILTRVHIDDATVEAIGAIHEHNARGFVMVRDELSALATGANQYKGGKGNDRQFWLKNWTGEPATIDRKNRATPTIIPHPFVALVGGIQPDLLNTLRDEKERDDGSIDRFLFCYPEAGAVPEWTWDEIPEAVAAPWRDTVLALLRLNMEPGDTGLRPHLVHLQVGARREWELVFQRLTARQNDPDCPPPMKGYLAKLKVYAARLALIIQTLRWVSEKNAEKNVDEESVLRAGLLVDYFADHASKVFATIGADPAVPDARRVLAWLETFVNSVNFVNGAKERTVSQRDIHAGVFGGSRGVDEVGKVITLLCKHNYLKPQELTPRPLRGRPPTSRFIISPWVGSQYSQKSRKAEGGVN